MCLAIVMEPGVSIVPRDIAKTAWEKNPDGAGYAYKEGGEVVIKKFLTNFDSFYNSLENDALANVSSPFLIHFRRASVGSVSYENVHPYRVGEVAVLMHNGTIPGYRSGGRDEKSDTRQFIDDALSDVTAELMDNYVFMFLLERATHRSKMAILLANGTVLMTNSDQWIKQDGILYSNKCAFQCESETPEQKWIPPYHPSGRAYHADDFCDICGSQFGKNRTHVYTFTPTTRETIKICRRCNQLPVKYLIPSTSQPSDFDLGLQVQCGDAGCAHEFWSVQGTSCPACESQLTGQHSQLEIVVRPKEESCATCFQSIHGEENHISFNMSGECMDCATARY